MTNALTLYAIADEYQALAQQLADMDLDAQTVADTLEGAAGALEVKALSVAAFVRNLEATAEAIERAEKELEARRLRIQRRADAIREYLYLNMKRCGISVIESPQFSLKIKKNTQKVVIDAEALLPWDFMVSPDPAPDIPDNKALADAMKAGRIIPGAHLEQTDRLEIK